MPENPHLPEDPDTAPTAGLGVPKPGAAGLLVPGEVLSGRFRIVRFLGRGGMGEVYEAEDLDLRERVALKTIRPELAANAQVMEHFRREIHLARKVTHPNVCRIFDLGRHLEGTGGQAISFLTMELLLGETLERRLAQQGRLSTEEAGPIAGQIAAALSAAHAAGVVHRDLKPGNVVLERRRDSSVRAVVTDFGLACLAGEAPARGETAERLVVGTEAYMSPEQAAGREASAASDLYSFGLVLYEMVTGRRVHRDASLLRRLDAEVPSPRELVPALDPGWEAAILRCLERDPARRFQSAAQVAQALGVESSVIVVSRRGPLLLAAALAAAVAAFGFQWWRARTAAVPRLVTVQVTTSLGRDLHPAFSPDGRQVAYSSDRGGDFQIYVQPLGPGGQAAALTSEGESFEPAWSPDGQWIAFHRRGGGIWVMSPKGGAARKLTDFGSRPAWSPDASLLAFQSGPLVDLAANALPALPPSTLWLVPREGGAPRPLTKPGEPSGGHGTPSWSPDGRRIVFGAADRRLAEIWSVGAQGAGLVRLLHDQPYASEPVVAPDGKHVYYAATSRASTYGLWRMPVSPDGTPAGAPVELANLGALRLRHLAVSRDGRRLAYSALGLASNLWAIRLSPSLAPVGQPRPLTSETGKSSRPAFSPDGTRIAFDRGRPGTPTDIWIMDAEGRAPRALTTEPAEDNLASWFPSGDRIVFASNRGGRFAVWSLGLAGGAPAPLLSLGQDIDWPRLSPDGTRLAFNSRHGGGTVNVWVASLAGGAPRQVTFDRELAGFPAWSPDGRTLAVEVKRGDHTQVAVLPAEGGELTVLTSDPGQGWPHSWSPDGEWIAFAGQRRSVWNVWAVHRCTREQRRLTSHESLDAYVRTPAFSPRGERVVYEYAQTTGNVWMVELGESGGRR